MLVEFGVVVGELSSAPRPDRVRNHVLSRLVDVGATKRKCFIETDGLEFVPWNKSANWPPPTLDLRPCVRSTGHPMTLQVSMREQTQGPVHVVVVLPPRHWFD